MVKNKKMRALLILGNLCNIVGNCGGENAAARRRPSHALDLLQVRPCALAASEVNAHAAAGGLTGWNSCDGGSKLPSNWAGAKVGESAAAVVFDWARTAATLVNCICSDTRQFYSQTSSAHVGAASRLPLSPRPCTRSHAGGSNCSHHGKERDGSAGSRRARDFDRQHVRWQRCRGSEASADRKDDDACWSCCGASGFSERSDGSGSG